MEWLWEKYPLAASLMTPSQLAILRLREYYCEEKLEKMLSRQSSLNWIFNDPTGGMDIYAGGDKDVLLSNSAGFSMGTGYDQRALTDVHSGSASGECMQW